MICMVIELYTVATAYEWFVTVYIHIHLFGRHNWLVLSDEQMSKRWPCSPLNDEQMSNWVGIKHLPKNWWRMGVPTFFAISPPHTRGQRKIGRQHGETFLRGSRWAATNLGPRLSTARANSSARSTGICIATGMATVLRWIFCIALVGFGKGHVSCEDTMAFVWVKNCGEFGTDIDVEIYDRQTKTWMSIGFWPSSTMALPEGKYNSSKPVCLLSHLIGIQLHQTMASKKQRPQPQQQQQPQNNRDYATFEATIIQPSHHVNNTFLNASLIPLVKRCGPFLCDQVLLRMIHVPRASFCL